MSEVIMELYTALEQLRETLKNIEVSTELKQQIEELVRPIFEDEVSRQKVTEIINEIGDFSENVLVPLLEQYISANVALRVKFLIEDLLVFVENYRDELVRKIEREKRSQIDQRRVANGSAVFRPNTMQRLSMNSATNHYRTALTSDQRKRTKAFTLMKTSQSQPIPAGRLSKTPLQLKLNTSFGVNNVVSRNQGMKPGTTLTTNVLEEEPTQMTSIVYNKDNSEIQEAIRARPRPTRSGQVVIKVAAVGLNVSDIPSEVYEEDTESPAEPPHVTQIKAISKSFLQLTGSTRGSRVKRKKAPQVLTDVIGQEFCGTIEDIAWKKGDLLHRMHVAKGNFVYGITSSGNGAIGEYIVCDVNDVVRCPGPIARQPTNAARLGVDGAVVCHTLAATDITNTRGTRILVVGGTTNKGMILLELLNKDLRIPYNNLQAVTIQDDMRILTEGGLLERNVFGFENYLEAIEDASVDIVFDCYSENDPERRNFELLLDSKLKRSAQFMKLNTLKTMRDKKSKQENWQQEFNLLNKLAKTRKLTLRMFLNEERVDYAVRSIDHAYSSIKAGAIVGKAVVEITKENIELIQQRLEN